MRDYIIGKYLKLIYLCLFQTEPGNKDLLRDTHKFAYFYGLSKIESNQVEALSIDYLEQLIGPESTEKTDEEKKKSLVSKYRSIMMERHARLLENEAINLQWRYKSRETKNRESRSVEELIEEGKTITKLIENASVVPERQNLNYHVVSKKWFQRWQAFT